MRVLLLLHPLCQPPWLETCLQQPAKSRSCHIYDFSLTLAAILALVLGVLLLCTQGKMTERNFSQVKREIRLMSIIR